MKTLGVFLLVVALTVGCSGSSRSASPTTTATTATTATTTSTTTGASTTPSTAVSTTTSTTVGFTPVAIPAAPGDVDGDGKPDTVTLATSATSAVLNASLTRLGNQSLPVQVAPFLLTDPHVHPQVLGVVDVDRDGFAEIAVQVDQGASTSLFTLIKLVNGRLTQVLFKGTQAQFPLGGSVGHFAEFGCGTGQLIEATWSLNDPSGSTYQGERDVYSLSGAQLTLVAKTTTTFTTNGSPPSESQLAAAGYLVHCPPID